MTVARELGEAPYGVALELAPGRLLVAELGGGERVAPAWDPREALAVVLDLGPELGQAALRPADREHLRIAGDVGRVLALQQPRELERLLRQALGIGEAAVERRAEGAQAHRVPAVEGLPDPLDDRRHRLRLGLRAPPVAELEVAMQSRVVRQELGLRV